ncbi:uncharacterized protein MELLADRAFT_89744 [Melampsora larici-populina 98AG31]|uniref:Uncharacterized protein n=1 Tax=Melampsora larici-populina (strain 98AG31 / pathotype 3-4-7) TaxID=747676 RepID=F4RUG5_MELLP|nr:uncharacterized protein MELLADRAFT_89744 [Melampsora larici-populina 98AG31]EGG03929.1 hypothetical protein MELLADRAFT_89744 [Melampsora larici-populina 98AG31]
MRVELKRLNSLHPSIDQLASLLQSPYPPSSIYLHSPSNHSLTSQLIKELLHQHSSSHLELHLPSYAYINLSEIQNTRSLYDRILNQLSGWNSEWSDAGSTTWNGRSYGLQCHPIQSAISPQINDILQNSVTPSTHCLAWNSDAPPLEKGRGVLSGKTNDSFDAFCDGLRTLSNLKYEDVSGEEKSFPRSPKFIIIDQAARMRNWKEPSLISAFSRLPELSRSPVHTIFLSHLPWTKVRPRYGALEPTVILIPKLSEQDLIKILVDEGPPETGDQTSDGIGESSDQTRDITPAFEPFVSFIVSAFQAQTSSDLFELSCLISRLWFPWSQRVRDGEFSPHDTAKLILLNRSMIEVEQQQFGRAIWHVPAFLNGDLGIKELALPASSVQPTPSKGSTTIDLGVGSSKDLTVRPPNILDSPSKGTSKKYPPISPFVTPSKPRHFLDIFSPASLSNQSPSKINASPSKPYNPQFGPPLTARQQPQDTLSLSLPIISRYLLIASFITSYNPAKSDARLFVTFDEVGTNRGRRARQVKPKIGEAVKVRERQQLLGPKSFPLSRLMAIFNAITHQEGLNFSQVDVLQQVSSLIQSRLLNKSNKSNNKSGYSNSERFEMIKLVCGIGEPIAQQLSLSVGFELRSRLWEVED